MASKTHGRRTGDKDHYLELVQQFPLTAIRDARHLAEAHRVLDKLMMIPEGRMTQGQAEYLEALAILVENYENKHNPIDTSGFTPIQMLQYLLEQNGMTASDLGRLLGNRSLGSKILREERSLSRRHIAILADRFKVSPSLFLQA